MNTIYKHAPHVTSDLVKSLQKYWIMANTVLAQQAIGKLKLWSTYFIRSGATFVSFPSHVDRLQNWLQFIAEALVTCGSISDLRFDQEPTWLPTLRKAARFGNVLTKTLDWLDGKNVLCNLLQHPFSQERPYVSTPLEMCQSRHRGEIQVLSFLLSQLFVYGVNENSSNSELSDAFSK